MGKKKPSHKITVTETPRQDAFDAAWAKYRPLVPAEELPALEESLNKPLPQAFRLNPLKITEADLTPMAERYGWELGEIAFCPEARRVLSAEVPPSHSAEHRAGQFYIQDSASMLPAMLYDAERLAEAPLMLDLAASPGGKTTHLISRSLDRGLILANDCSASRIPALKTVLKNWGSLNHAITQFNGESYGDWFPNTFDLILLDAPCSMQSLVSIDSHPMRPITEREEKALAQRQTALLRSALRALKPGGQIVYSTCTLSPDEDEGVVDRVLKDFPGAVRVVDSASRLPRPAPGLTAYDGQELDPSVRGAVRLWPHRYQTAGFFACLLEKTKAFENDLTEDKSTAPFRGWEKSSFTEAKPAEQAELAARLDDQLGLSLNELQEETGTEVYRRGEEFWMLPERFLRRFSTLPCKSAGMRVASRTPGGLIPDNDWVSRFFRRAQGQHLTADPEQAQEWVHGSDLRVDTDGLTRGSLVLVTDDHGIFLGCGKVSGDRIRNFDK